MEEIRQELEELKRRIGELEVMVGGGAARVSAAADDEAESIDTNPIDISIDDLEFNPASFEPEPAAVAENAKPLEAKPEDAFVLEAESINDKEEKKARKAVMDVLGDKYDWRNDVVGTPVKNVISAISLNDRALIINTLFKEDAQAFQEAIAAFNAMASFDEAEKYVFEKYPDWKFKSDTVYRLMMAVRRKLR